MRVIFINRFYAPDISATAQILSDVAEGLAAKGIEVSVFTSRLSYDSSEKYSAEDIRNDVTVRRLWTSRFGRGNLWGRTLDYVSFFLSCMFAVIRFVRKEDIVVVKTDPPLLSVVIGLFIRLKRAKYINWLQDVYPEVAFELTDKQHRGLIFTLLRNLRNRSLNGASYNVVISDRMRERIAQNCASPDTVEIIENFTDDTAITPRHDHASELRNEWDLAPTDFVIGYSGNLGRAHDLTTMFDAARALRHAEHIKFLFIGGGHLHSELRQRIDAESLNNFVLKPYLPREELPVSLSLPDIHWVSLKPSLEGLIVPSKVYGIAAAGRPMVFIGRSDGDIGTWVKTHDMGQVFEIGDVSELSKAILELSKTSDRISEMGENARSFIDKGPSRARQIEKWASILRVVDESGQGFD